MNVYFDLEINIRTLYKVMSLGYQGFYFRNLSLGSKEDSATEGQSGG